MTNTSADSGFLLDGRFSMRIEFEADWHVGAGSGRSGHIDRLVVRDADGLPYLPAKTLTGIVRDACESLAQALDEGQSSRNWSKCVEILFGSQPAIEASAETPVNAAVSIRPARFSAGFRRHLAGVQARPLVDAVTFIKPGVAIDRASGRAKQKHLRLEEMVRAGAVLEADCSVDWRGRSAETQRACSALLVAAAKLVERLGGKRRRGSGRCNLSISSRAGAAAQSAAGAGADEKTGASVAAAVEWLRKNPAAVITEPAADPAGGSAASAAAAGEPWVEVALMLKTETPLAATCKKVGNVLESLDYVPGTYLLPHVTRMLGELGIDIGPSVLRGDLRVSPATIEVGAQAGRPVPLALVKHKQGGGFDKRGTILNRLWESPPPGLPTKPVRRGYVGHATAQTLPQHTSEVPRGVLTHNTVEDKLQRPDTSVGGVYSYEAISPGTQLRCTLSVRQSLANTFAAACADWKTKLTGPCRLGRSKKDDFGLVQVTLPDEKNAGQNDDQSTSRLKCVCDPVSRKHRLVVWLLSDLLVRGALLRPDPTAEGLQVALEQALSPAKLTLRGDVGDLVSAATRTRRVDSWQVKWCLPRPSLIGLAAGSCFVFEADRAIPAADLQRVEAEGLGDRRAEGYGRIRFNEPLVAEPLGGWNGSSQASNPATPDAQAENSPAANAPAASSPAEPSAALHSIDADFAARVEEEAWRTALRRAVLGFADNEAKRRQHFGWRADTQSPPMSQLGGLRAVVQQVRSFADRQTVVQWIKHVQARANRRDKWPERSLDAIHGLFDSEKVEAVWNLLELPSLPAANETARTRMHEMLWPDAVRGVIDACIRAHKRQIEAMGRK